MVITYAGERCFKIQSGKVSIITDPLPRFKGDITLHTQNLELGTKNSVLKTWPPEAGHIYGPGEYEISEVEMGGFPASGGLATTYLVKTEEMRLVFMGEAMQEMEPGLLDKLGEVDILFAPAGISAKVIKQIQPKIVIPSYIKPAEVAAFLKEVEKKAEPEEKLVIKKKDITPGMKVVVLKA